ncbi:hypothetical protein NDU88_003534 [Pleurodeles waltl]|uniref:Uncharacterized protein n=1 Tax=Pleurodeles waltl TaxID=8319 RepID=A0AAV7WPC7_PLEWA|nr:hypothetical protein NDU88_003534 [Pleurodeles waltl]
MNGGFLSCFTEDGGTLRRNNFAAQQAVCRGTITSPRSRRCADSVCQLLPHGKRKTSSLPIQLVSWFQLKREPWVSLYSAERCSGVGFVNKGRLL